MHVNTLYDYILTRNLTLIMSFTCDTCVVKVLIPAVAVLSKESMPHPQPQPSDFVTGGTFA